LRCRPFVRRCCECDRFSFREVPALARGVRQRQHVGAGFSQKLARLVGDFLSVAQVTRVVVGGFVLRGDVGWGSPSDFLQPLMDVADFAVPCFGE